MRIMPGSATAEVIFIAGMMVLILVISIVAVYFFVKTYRKEMAEKKERLGAKRSRVVEATGAKGDETNGAS